MHVMIDIETLGKKPGSIVASIGAVAFDPKSGAILEDFSMNIDLEDAQAYGLTMDVDTVKWWLGQSEEAREALLQPGYTLPVALSALSDFVDSCRKLTEADFAVWAHSPSFDLVLLEAAYRACRIEHPWTHREPRDTRTLYALADVKPGTFLTGTAHDPLDDARAQAVAVAEAFRRLNLRTFGVA